MDSRYEEILARYKEHDSGLLTLGIETSCDDTSASVVRGSSDVLAVCTNSQIELHSTYGGVVPELASRDHVKNLYPVVTEALRQAGIQASELSAIAVTAQPGLLGALLTGLNFAKGMAMALGIPFVGVNHIFGHICANYISAPELKSPFICLVASGGHTQYIHVTSEYGYEILGGTCDDAAGEALDKIARALGLGYPGGPLLEQLAKEGNPKAYSFRSAFNMKDSPDMSFSGIKTAAVNLMHNARQTGRELPAADIAASFQAEIVHTLVSKLVLMAKKTGIDRIAIAGGVTANGLLRSELERAAKMNRLELYCPEKKYCTDNGAMIACAGYRMLAAGRASALDLDADAND